MAPPRSVHHHHRRSSVQKGKGKRKRQSRHPKKRLVQHRRHLQKRHSRSKKKRSHQRGGFINPVFNKMMGNIGTMMEKIEQFVKERRQKQN
jgi:hypothetical protein